VWIGYGAVINSVLANVIKRYGKVTEGSTVGLSLPLSPMPAVPAMPVPVSLETTGTSVLGARLAPGSYGALVVRPGSTMFLAGGLYGFDRVSIGDGATLMIEGPTEIRVAGRVAIGRGAYVRPSGNLLGVGDGSVVLHVLGGNATTRTATTGSAVEIGVGAILHAYVVAPNGTIRVARNAVTMGSLIGRVVDVGQQVRLSPWTYLELPPTA
jgi:hypothetical protein